MREIDIWVHELSDRRRHGRERRGGEEAGERGEGIIELGK
jgi:hypothetical protein